MSQNLPPNPPGQPGDYNQGYQNQGYQHQGYDPNYAGQGNNPYFSQQGQTEPDLDANAPQLKTAEAQRLNRKALLFLAGIVGLLLLMTFLVLKSGDDDKEKEAEAAKKKREEKVVIPDLPRTAAGGQFDGFEQAAADPQPPAPQELPPLPPAEPIAVVDNSRSPRPRRYEDSDRQTRQTYRDDPVAAPMPTGPTLAERRMGVAPGSSGGAARPTAGAQQESDPVLDAMLRNLQSAQGQAGGAQGAAAGQSGRSAMKDVSVAKYLNNPDTLMVRGTYIRCVLETRIITDLKGFTSCVVTEPVYSINGRHLLLPKGSKISGTYEGEPTGPRVGVIWDRITTPTGVDVAFASPGVDNLGGAGHPGDYNAHWGSRMGSALLISLISDAFKYAAAENGPTTTTMTGGGTVVEQPFESNTARTMERLAGQALNKAMARPATVTINQGTVVNIYVAQDVDFSAVIAKR